MEHPQHLGPALKEARHLEARLHLVRQAHPQRAGASEGQPAVVGGGHLAELQDRLPHHLPVLVVGHRDGAEQAIRVAKDVLGQGCVMRTVCTFYAR